MHSGGSECPPAGELEPESEKAVFAASESAGDGGAADLEGCHEQKGDDLL